MLSIPDRIKLLQDPTFRVGDEIEVFDLPHFSDRWQPAKIVSEVYFWPVPPTSEDNILQQISHYPDHYEFTEAYMVQYEVDGVPYQTSSVVRLNKDSMPFMRRPE